MIAQEHIDASLITVASLIRSSLLDSGKTIARLEGRFTEPYVEIYPHVDSLLVQEHNVEPDGVFRLYTPVIANHIRLNTEVPEFLSEYIWRAIAGSIHEMPSDCLPRLRVIPTHANVMEIHLEAPRI